jgi:hypothetical protein
MARVASLVLLAVCFFAGCGGDDQAPVATETPETTTTEAAPQATTEAKEPVEDAADFLERIVQQRSLGQHGRVWESLHPLHQAVASRAEYVGCEGQNEIDAEIEDIEVVDQYDEPLEIPGQTADVPSKAVTIRLTVKIPLIEEPQVVTRTAHAVAEDGEWRWILTPEDYRAYQADRCPPAG